MLSNEQITKFQMLCQNHLNRGVGREEAYEKGAKLIRLLELIYRPITENEYQKLKEYQNKINKLNL